MRFKISICTLAVLICCHNFSFAYDSEEVHPQLNEEVSRKSTNLDRVLTDAGMAEGVDTVVKSKPVYGWFRLGGIEEDTPPRWRNHFHDPTKSWDEARSEKQLAGDLFPALGTKDRAIIERHLVLDGCEKPFSASPDRT
jgi:hypothetical protein